QRLVVGQHREDDVAPGRGFADAAGDLRAAPLELVGLRARPVVDDEVVLATDDPAADCLPHAAKSDESDFHVLVVSSGRKNGVRHHFSSWEVRIDYLLRKNGV